MAEQPRPASRKQNELAEAAELLDTKECHTANSDLASADATKKALLGSKPFNSFEGLYLHLCVLIFESWID